MQRTLRLIYRLLQHFLVVGLLRHVWRQIAPIEHLLVSFIVNLAKARGVLLVIISGAISAESRNSALF